jgi:hypothetical protein
LSFDYILEIQFIGTEHLLVKALFCLFLLKVDYKLWQISVLAKYDSIYGTIFLDSLDNRKFIVNSFNGCIVGSFTGDKITFGQPKELLHFGFKKLSGSQLFGFRKTDRENDAGIPFWQYFKVDLKTLTEQAVDVPMILGKLGIKPYVSL